VAEVRLRNRSRLSCEPTASCAAVDFGVTTTVPLPDHLFFDGFESGDTTIWDDSTHITRS